MYWNCHETKLHLYTEPARALEREINIIDFYQTLSHHCQVGSRHPLLLLIYVFMLITANRVHKESLENITKLEKAVIWRQSHVVDTIASFCQALLRLLFMQAYTLHKKVKDILKFSRFFLGLFREWALIVVFISRYWDNFLDFLCYFINLP